MMRPPNRKAMRTSRKAVILASTSALVKLAIALNWETETVWHKNAMIKKMKNLQQKQPE